ncbi:MAG: FAD-dependent oxidoreductase, partial [Candidatus Hydrogenedentes bacterium]|nr:FAD-dependent oxidoreductase [Candidatus Hydrogenedentota bacterium]
MNLQLDDRPFRTVNPAIANSGMYRAVSYWQETVPITLGAALKDRIACDVAVVGGGYTGLSTALTIKTAAPQLEVVLLEYSVVGHGASGRNGGFSMPLIGWDLTDAAGKLGEDGARKAYRLMYAAVDHLRRTITDRAIDCDMEETGYLLLATCKARLRRVRHEVELGKRLGFDLEYLEGSALREHIASESFLAGAYDPHPFIVNPAKLARGLKGVVEKAGVRVFEQTPVTRLEDGKPIRITTPEGAVSARAVVL